MAFGLILLATIFGFATGVTLLITGASILMSILGFYSVSFVVLFGPLTVPFIREQRARDAERADRSLAFPAE